MNGDVQSEFGPTWYSGVTALPDARPALNFDLDVDVCVVGGGLAGLTVAREVVRRGSSVALLEARRIAWNASGRNAGVVLPGFPARLDKIVERVGLPAAKALWGLSEAGVGHVRDTLAELRLVAEGHGWLDVSTTPNAEAALARLALLGQEFGAQVEGWPIDRVREVLKTRHYFHALHFPRAFHIDPLAYALALAAAAERGGTYIFEHTPVFAIDTAGVRKRVVTPKARLRAGRIVLAGNIYLGAVARRLADSLVPATAYAGVTRPLGSNLARAIAFAGAVGCSGHAGQHYRIVGGDRLLWSGGTALRRGGAGLKRRFEQEIRSIYPQLGPVAFESFWPGDIGFAIHRMPQIGELQPGVWLASGLGGQGLNTSALAGHLIARAIVEGDDTWRLFLPYELVWAGGRAGRALFAATTWWSHQRETLLARIARRREQLAERRLRAEAGLPAEAPHPAYHEVDASAMERSATGRSATSDPRAAAVSDRDAAAPESAEPQPPALPQTPGKAQATAPASESPVQAEPAPSVPVPPPQEQTQAQPATPAPDAQEQAQKQAEPEVPMVEASWNDFNEHEGAGTLS
jgi:glycine/D-amino acid oxidase-like deaminating enzyme